MSGIQIKTKWNNSIKIFINKDMAYMRTLQGMASSSGFAVGITCVYSDEYEESVVSHYNISEEQVSNEIARLKEGFEKAKSLMQDIIKVSEKFSDKKVKEIFNTHLMILNDPELFEKMSGLIKEKKINAEHAVADVFEEYINKYKTKDVHFRELVYDFIDLRSRVLTSLGGAAGHFECPVGERQPVIVASKRLTPHMVLNIPREDVLAFVTEEGGYTTHSAILARSFGIPVIFGINVKENLKCTDRVIVDGFSGKVIVLPDEETEKYYLKKIEKYNKRKVFCDTKRDISPQTKSHIRVKLKFNISAPNELEIIKNFRHDGIGLLRTEFLFLEKEKPPSEDEQFDMYKLFLEGTAGKPVVVRLLDIGADKLPLYFKLPPQTNPDLEIKGARAVEGFYDIYLAQAKALLRAAKHGDLRILYPMVSDTSDVFTFKKLFSDAKKVLRAEKKTFNDKITYGIMIETPSAALMADKLLKDVGFANIGSNDLLQYTLAASRGNPLVEKRYHILHPSMVKLFEMIVRAGRIHKKEICLCGEVGSIEEFYPLFLKIGLRSFSVAPARFPYIKCDLLHIGIAKKSNMLKKFYSAESKHALDKLFKRKYDFIKRGGKNEAD